MNSNSNRWRRWLRSLLWAVLVIATLVPLYYAIENKRGATVWQTAKQAYEAEGYTLDLRDTFEQEAIPEEDNLFAIPLLRGINQLDDEAERKRTRLINSLRMKRSFKRAELLQIRNFENGIPIDYEAWRTHLIAIYGLDISETEPDAERAVLIAVEQMVDWFPILDAESHRPHGQLVPLTYTQVDFEQPWKLSTPHLSASRSMTRLLVMRAIAAIGCEEWEIARKSLRTCFRLVEAQQREPLIISHLVGISVFAQMARPLWDGLHAQAWEEPDLAWLSKELARFDWRRAYGKILQVEASFMVMVLDTAKDSSIRQWKEMGLQIDRRSDLPQLYLMPDGRWDLYKAQRMEQFTKLLQALQTESFAEVKAVCEARKGDSRLNESIIAGGTPDMIQKVSRSTALAQTMLSQLRIAVALEQHRLRAGKYPASLESLPEPIQQIADPMSQGWRYRPNAEGTDYHLYSVGWDLDDDDGTPVDPSNRNQGGDWVWYR